MVGYFCHQASEEAAVAGSFIEINYGCLSNLHCEKFNICLKKSNIKLKITNNKLDFYIRIRYDKFKIRMKQSGIELFYTKSKVIT